MEQLNGNDKPPWYQELDESMAILGVIGIAVIALFICKAEAGMQIVNTAIGGLIGYIGRGRLQK